MEVYWHLCILSARQNTRLAYWWRNRSRARALFFVLVGTEQQQVVIMRLACGLS